MSKNTKLIIILLIIIIIALVSYYAFKAKNIINITPGSSSLQNTSKTPVVNTNISASFKTYTNDKYELSLQYPDDFITNESNDGGFYNELNIYNLAINPPADYQKGTDFSNGSITISVSPTTAKCYYGGYSNRETEDMTAIKIINGKSFHYNLKQPFGDNAMGGRRGEDSLFSVVENEQCYRIEKLVGYQNLHGFVDEPYDYPSHFDEQKVNSDLDTIISSIIIK